MKTGIKTVAVGFLEENCYLLMDDSSGTLYVIDPGAEEDKILKAAKSFVFSKCRIILTHGHIDHIGAVRPLMERLPVEFCFLHHDDLPLYKSPDNALPPWIPRVKNPPEPVTNLPAECPLRLIHCPGHTKGSSCFYLPRESVLFSGDSIFKNSVGRTDLPGGDHEALVRSLKEKVLSLPPDTKILPGHGPETTVAEERANNPFFDFDL